REQVADGRVRRRRGPEGRARRAVVGVEAVEQTGLERGAARAAAGSDARRGQVLAERREALLPEDQVEGALGDVVPEPLVHVLVVEGAERRPGRAADRAARERDLALHLLLEARRRDANDDAVGRQRPWAVEELLEVDDVLLVVDRDLVGRLPRRGDRARLRLVVLDAGARA